MRFQRYLLIFFIVILYFSFLFPDHVLANALIPSLKQQRMRCHDHEKAALLQFKKSFLIDCDASTPPFAYPKIKSWQEHAFLANGSKIDDCCTWNGVECDKVTSFVIGLDLSSSCLYGTFPSNSTLFSLDHLQELNLADNNFGDSPIPPSIGRLYMLTSLNLSNSCFRGLVPSQMSSLSRVSILDLRYNSSPTDVTPTFPEALAFDDHKHSLDKLVTNLTRLTQLYLDYVDISSTVPSFLSNITSLTVISLSVCNLYGALPQGIFQLPHLLHIDLCYNDMLEGHLPEFHPNSPLITLHLQETGLSGELPSTIGNLGHLKELSIDDTSISGHLPDSLGNLTELTLLSLTRNDISGTMPSSLTNVSNLEYLSLSGLNVSPAILDSWLLKLNKLTEFTFIDMNMGKKIPAAVANLTKLNALHLENDRLSGSLPCWFANLTQLTELHLLSNQLGGPIQPYFSKLVNLQWLVLSCNNFFGMVDQLFELPNIQGLFLKNLKLTFLPNKYTNYSSLSTLTWLSLSSCNLTEFPQILRGQKKLQLLHLEDNHIKGHVPQWFVDETKQSLIFLNLSSNSLLGFEHPLVVLPWTNLAVLDFRDNRLRGPLPIPTNTIQIYDFSNNHLNGALPNQICLANNLKILDLSNNSMSGHIPHCISRRLGNSLQLLNLRGNRFHGNIPQKFYKSCSLKMINLSDNQLEGQLPISLANCTMLEVLDLGGNRVNDKFPSWLGKLSALQVLVLRHNRFYGTIGDNLKSCQAFGRLRIIDLSHNFLVGTLPSSYIQIWRAMQVTSENQSSSSNTIIYVPVTQPGRIGKVRLLSYSFNYIITIANKGSETLYPRILTILRVVDFSSNSFTGKIPSFLGDLRGLQALNLSNNNLEGNIPLSISTMSDLQSLDLSQNKISGVIPQELDKLTFLEVFNVSHNHLVGSIPQGDQFNTFDNSSYEGNLALCGDPLSRQCRTVPPSPGPPSQQESNGDGNDEEGSDSISWMVRALGCASGFIVGSIVGKLYITDKYHGWFMKTFAKKRKLKKRGRKASNRTRNQ